MENLINFVDICILPSYYREGTPRFLLESMACAKPIITTEMPGCEHLIDKVNPNGILVKPRDHIGLAEAITKVNMNPEKYNGQNSLNLYISRFSENIVYSAIQKYYSTTN
jgi:glycosyltransferase involved in cell wall biosynthesis